MTQGYKFPIGTTPKENSVSELGVIFWGSPLFLAIPTLEVQLPLILVRFQRNSGEPSGSSKKSPRRTTDPVRAGITEKWAFLRSAEKWFLASKWVLPQKIIQNDISPLDYLGKGTFFFEQLFPVVARTWLELKSDRLFWPKILVFGPK